MAGAEPFDPYSSNLVTGPVNKSRWIYASCKQLMDRVIHAYGEHHSLNYTIFRPFNWFGPGLDSIQTPGEGGSRVVTSFIASLMTNSDMVLVDGGSQRRAFTHVDDGIDALIRILQNRAGVANRRIYNIGTPTNDASILELAELLLQVSEDIPQLRGASARVSLKAVDSTSFYGEGYQDVQNRLPDISHTMIELGWRPRIDLRTGLLRTVQWYANEVLERSEQYDG